MNISIEQLQKNFGTKKAVDITSFEIKSGDILGLVGNNGAGKSTLFRLILDLLKADSGKVTIYDSERSVNPAETEQWKEWTGAYIDDSFIIDYLTPEEYLEFVAKITNLSEEEMQQELKKYEHFMAGEVLGQEKLIRNLSAGNKQKVGIVAAMLMRPRILILDEPFNFLDPSSQNAFKRIVTEYNKETGATILISSHNLNHTIDISTRIALLENGTIIRDITNEGGAAQAELENYFDTE